jgi:hypothetical protein
VERLAREQAKLDGAACLVEAEKDVEAKADARGAQRILDDKAEHDEKFAEEEGECCSSGSCGDSLPGEKKERSVAETVKASTGGGCGSDSCGCD